LSKWWDTEVDASSGAVGGLTWQRSPAPGSFLPEDCTCTSHLFRTWPACKLSANHWTVII